MSHNEDSKNSSKSDGASSDICIVDNGSANSSNKAAGWKRSSPSSPTYTLANKNINPSPRFTNTPSLALDQISQWAVLNVSFLHRANQIVLKDSTKK